VVAVVPRLGLHAPNAEWQRSRRFAGVDDHTGGSLLRHIRALITHIITSKAMRRCWLSLVLLLAWLMTGCSPLAASSPSPLATITPKAIQPTPSSVTPASRQEPTATATAVPTRIAELPTATPDIIETVTAFRQPRIYATYPSSDGQWRMEVVIFDCVPVGETDEAAYEQLKLIRASDGVEQIVDTQLIYCGGLGAYGFKGLFWSPNSHYFYYTGA